MQIKPLISVIAVSALTISLSACSTSTRDTGEATLSSPTPTVTELPMSATPEPTESASATEEPSGSLTGDSVVAGPATVGGVLGDEPTVDVKSGSAPVKELIVKDVSLGKGQGVIPGATVTAHYVGYGANSGVMFDSSWARMEPATFPLDGVIEGWQVGLVGMKEGGRRILVIPAAMGYGDLPPDGSGIEPGETLIFVVDMITVS